MDITNVSQYINPNKSPKQTFIYINADDPRNNQSFLDANPNVVVLSESDLDLTGFSFDEISDESFDPTINLLTYGDFIPAQPADLSETPTYILKEPQNLKIDSSGFKVQTDAADGTVYYTAILTFDDVDMASSYEVRINAINS